jgi:hypothetical protein
MYGKYQLVPLKREDRDQILHEINQLQQNNMLQPFLDLSTIINTATGKLPTKMEPILQKLNNIYSQTHIKLNDYLNPICDILIEVVIMCIEAIDHEMNTEDYTFVKDLGNKLDYHFINELEEFIKEARQDLVDIYSTLLMEASGGRLQQLLDTVAEREKGLLKSANDLRAEASKKNAFKNTEKEFDEVLKEIQDICEKSGTRDPESIKMVDTLAHGVRNASDSLVTAYGRIKTHLEAIDIDPDIFLDSVNDALRLIAIADQFNSTDKISYIQKMLLDKDSTSRSILSHRAHSYFNRQEQINSLFLAYCCFITFIFFFTELYLYFLDMIKS